MSKVKKILLSNPKRAAWLISSKSAESWEREGAQYALYVYRQAVREVPAYASFLRERGLDESVRITTLEAFKSSVPVMDKRSYLKKYDPAALAAGSVADFYTMCASSGSTGTPMFVMNSRENFQKVSVGMEIFFDYLWDVASKKKKVLYINAMATGMWIGGVLADFVFKNLCDKYPHFSFVNPGSDVERVVDVVNLVGASFDVVVIASYPSCIKNIFELGEQKGVNWHKVNLRLASVGEMVDNSLYDYFLEKMGTNRKDLTALFDVYGGTEIGAPGISTPLTTKIKDITRRNRRLSQKIFGNEVGYGSLFQSNPTSCWIEVVDGDIVITEHGKMPVVRYNIQDVGNFFTWKQMMEIVREEGVDIEAELRQCGWNKKSFQWPFITFSHRKDWSVSFLGAKIAPQSLQRIFSAYPNIYSFRLAETDFREKIRFTVPVELQTGVMLSAEAKGALAVELHDKILEHLLKSNFDYRDAYETNQRMLDPKVILYTRGSGPFEGNKNKKPRLV